MARIVTIIVLLFSSSVTFAVTTEEAREYFLKSLALRPTDRGVAPITRVEIRPGKRLAGVVQATLNGLASLDDLAHKVGGWSPSRRRYALLIEQNGIIYSCRGIISQEPEQQGTRQRYISIEDCNEAPFPIGYVHQQLVDLDNGGVNRNLPDYCRNYRSPCEMPQDVKRQCTEGMILDCNQ